MNYEPGTIEQEPRLVLPAPEAPRRLRLWWVLAALLGVAAIVWAVVRHDAAKPVVAHGGSDAPAVTVTTPGRTTVERQVTATGSLAARIDMPVGVAGEGGRVTAVLVQPGQWVHAGQVLATVDRSVQVQTAASLSAQIKVAQADATLAQSELDRAQQLVGRGFISKADIQTKTATRDAANARVRVAQAQLAQQQASNGRLDVRAPAEGLVLTRQVEPGQIVSSGSGTLFRMAQRGEFELRAQMAEMDLAGLHVGARAVVTPVGGARSFEGRVWQVSPVIDPASRQGIARIALPFDPALRPGGFASAVITGGAAQAPMLPESAVLSDRAGNYVYIVDAQNRAQRRNVKVGEVTDAGVSIAGGLAGTERVVLAAGAFLSAGQKVAPVLRTAAAAAAANPTAE